MLVVFDVDGTLTRSTGLDARLYAQAFRDVFGVPLPSTDWNDYHDATDRAIAEEAVQRLGCDARGIAAMRERFLDLLAYALRRGGPPTVPGAAEMLARLRGDGHAIALATGAWAASARLKLKRAGLPLEDVPLVGSDEHPRREQIVQAAMLAPADRIVLVGDGAWDVRAAARLELPFVGVDAEGDGRLRALGLAVVADYRDAGAFVAALERAEPPTA